jgi:hypothetical protein
MDFDHHVALVLFYLHTVQFVSVVSANEIISDGGVDFVKTSALSSGLSFKGIRIIEEKKR